jgi:hypothetical protein
VELFLKLVDQFLCAGSVFQPHPVTLKPAKDHKIDLLVQVVFQYVIFNLLRLLQVFPF